MKNIINILKREKIKLALTGYLGKVREDEETITCYVSPLRCGSTMFIGYKAPYNFLEKYNLNKKIVYVIDNVNFNSFKVHIHHTGGGTLIIKNCGFPENTEIISDGNLVLNNISIYNHAFCNKLLIYGSSITIQNCDLGHFHEKEEIYDYNLNINSTINITIENSLIRTSKANFPIILEADNGNINLVNSIISGKSLKLQAKEITSDPVSYLHAKEEINIKTDKLNTTNVSAPKVVLNNEKFLETENYKNRKAAITENERWVKNQELADTLANTNNSSNARTLKK